MTKDGRDILRVISREQITRLEALGATVTDTLVTATEEQLWRSGMGAGTRRVLERRGSLSALSGDDSGGGGETFFLLLNGSRLTLNGSNLTLGAA